MTIYLFQRLTLKKPDTGEEKLSPAAEMRNRIIRRAALEFEDGMYGILGHKVYVDMLLMYIGLLSTRVI